MQSAKSIERDGSEAQWFRCSYTNLANIFFHVEEQLQTLAEQLAKVM